MTRAAWCGVLMLLAACRQKPEWHELSRNDSDGFVDIDLPARLVSAGKKSATVRTTAAWRGAPIELEIEFTETRAAGGASVFGWGTAVIRPGPHGADPLLAVLAAAYGMPNLPRRFRPTVPAKLAILEGSPDAMRRGFKSKLFFSDDGPEEGYGELFANFDPRGVLQLHEKDPEYRAAVLAALTNE